MAEQPEPNGWELLRSVKDVKDSVDKLAAGMVTQTMFQLYQASVSTQMAENRAAATKDQTEANEKIKELQQDRDETRRTKAQQWFLVGLALVTALGSVVTQLILNGLR